MLRSTHHSSTPEDQPPESRFHVWRQRSQFPPPQSHGKIHIHIPLSRTLHPGSHFPWNVAKRWLFAFPSSVSPGGRKPSRGPFRPRRPRNNEKASLAGTFRAQEGLQGGGWRQERVHRSSRWPWQGREGGHPRVLTCSWSDQPWPPAAAFGPCGSPAWRWPSPPPPGSGAGHRQSPASLAASLCNCTACLGTRSRCPQGI